MKQLYLLTDVFEFEFESDMGRILGRIELLREFTDKTAYRIRVYESDIFRLLPSFGSVDSNAIEKSDEQIWTQRGFPPSGRHCIDFVCSGDGEARETVLETIERIYDHVTAQAV